MFSLLAQKALNLRRLTGCKLLIKLTNMKKLIFLLLTCISCATYRPPVFIEEYDEMYYILIADTLYYRETLDYFDSLKEAKKECRVQGWRIIK
jgi:hypothetical protein